MEKAFSGFNPKSKGFTLLELMVIVAIVGLMASMAFSYYTGTPRERMRSASRDVVSLMLSAKVNARKSGKIWYVQFDTGSPGKFTLYESDGNNIDPANDTPHSTVELSKYTGVTFGSGHGKDTAKKTYTKMDDETVDILYDPGPDSIDDGITVSDNRFVFDPEGLANTASLGAVYLKIGNGDTMVVERMTAAGLIKTRQNFDGNWKE